MDDDAVPTAEMRAKCYERSAASRRIEAERLIGLAKSLLTQPEEEIAAIYLDHAIDTLQSIPA